MASTRAFRALLEACHYVNVKISEAELPPHIIEWARGDDTEMSNPEISETIPYFRVTSAQGSFGIAMAVYNLIDLKDTGFNALDLGEIDASEDFFLVSLSTVNLIYLKNLLANKKPTA